MLSAVAHPDRAIHMLFVFVKQSRCPDQHGGVCIMAAGRAFCLCSGGQKTNRYLPAWAGHPCLLEAECEDRLLHPLALL
jgi:hypothetical protein